MSGSHAWTYVVPHWLLVLLTGAFTIAPSLYRRLRRCTRRLGHCPNCNYDLRAHTATPDARCPECGRPVAAIRP